MAGHREGRRCPGAPSFLHRRPPLATSHPGTHPLTPCLHTHPQVFRVDHIIGFFRIWEIPGDCWSGMMGHFRPCIPIARAELEAKGIWDFHRHVGHKEVE